MMAKRYRAILTLLVLVYLASILIGVLMAVFGSQSDVNQGEQSAALFFGIGMTVFGIVGFVCAAREQSKERLRVPLICAGGAMVSFLLVLAFGP